MKKDDLIIVIDMQNVYLPGEAWGCPGILTASKNIVKLLEKTDSHVAFTRYIASEDPTLVWKEYNKENQAINEDAWLNDFTDDMKPFITKYPCFTKSTYSSFSIPELRALATDACEKGANVVLCGVVADCCVLSTAFAGIDLGLKLTLLTDAVADMDDSVRVVSSSNEKLPYRETPTTAVLKGLSPLHIELMTTEQYLCN